MSDISERVTEFCFNNDISVKLEDFDSAFIGYIKGFEGAENIACYDYEACIQCLMSYRMERDDAIIYIEHNILPLFDEYSQNRPQFLVKYRG